MENLKAALQEVCGPGIDNLTDAELMDRAGRIAKLEPLVRDLSGYLRQMLSQRCGSSSGKTRPAVDVVFNQHPGIFE